MSAQLDDDTRVLLEAAFGGAKRYAFGSEAFSDSTHAYTFSDPNGTRTTISFEGSARVDFDKAARSLARHALREDGLSPDQLRLLIAQACWKEPTIGREAAVTMAAEGVARPRREFKVAFTSRDFVRHDEFEVGSVTFTKALPEHLREWDQGDGSLVFGFEPPCATAVVTGSDQESARVLAAERLDEARSVLALAHTGPLPRSVPKHVISGTKDGQLSVSSQRRARLTATAVISDDGMWWPGYRELSNAAAQPQQSRTDWERRCVAACRWFFHAADTTWYSEALVQAMSALECLFVAGSKTGKGGALAKRASSIYVLPGRTRKQQQRWLLRLYALRNSAVHEGLSIADDLDVDDLLALVQRLLHWAVFHLNPMHRDPNAVCVSLEEVFSKGLHSAR